MNFEGVQPDAETVGALCADISQLFTDEEQETLRGLARQAAEVQGAAFEVVVNAAARRAGDSAQETVNGRDAGARWFALMCLPQAFEKMNEVVRPAS